MTEFQAERVYTERQKFVRAVLHLLTCHPHRFAVHNDTLTIQGSIEAMDCTHELDRA